MHLFSIRPLRFILFAAAIGIKMVLVQSCANIIPPTGGPRDSLPPALISAVPKNNSTRFDSKKVVFNFDEFLELKDVQQNITVSPVPKQDPLFQYKLRTITIQIRDTLEPNTTYTINFGKSIRDINEGNMLKNFTYTFSTGTYIDSLELSGNIIIASTGSVDSSLIAMLYTNPDDSAVIKDRPRYIARCDSSGHFLFRNLKGGQYRIYGLKDEGGQKKYLSKSQYFAFADEPVTIGLQNNPVTLYAYNDTSGTKPSGSKSKQKGAAPPKLSEKEKVKRLVINTNTGEGALDILGNLIFVFEHPLKYFDSTKVRFTDDKFVDIKSYHYEMDSTKKKLTLFTKWNLGQSYFWIAQKDFAEDSLGDKLLKIDTISIRTRSSSDYGSLRIRFINLPMDRHPVLQFMQQDVLKKSQKLTSNLFFDKLFLPGDYDLRILYDDNENGVWDPGEFFIKHKQPEKVIRLKKKLTVKGNWDNQVEYQL
jgi:Big-like domain-containing protein